MFNKVMEFVGVCFSVYVVYVTGTMIGEQRAKNEMGKTTNEFFDNFNEWRKDIGK